MGTSHRQTKLTKAARFVIRRLNQGHDRAAGAICQAVHRYRVKPHDLWLHLQLTYMRTDL